MDTITNLPERINEAHRRLDSVVLRSPLEYSGHFSRLTDAQVYFKCENLQRTGSFKLRGAANRFLGQPPNQPIDCLVAASTGNHGKAVAAVAAQFDKSCHIFVPDNADRTKVDKIVSMGADVRVSGSDCVQSEAAARQFALQNNACYISPYNDPLVIAGQGTIGRELSDQLEGIDAVFASLGGGGLISGVAASLKAKFPGCRMFGCSPVNSQVMIQSLAQGKILSLPSKETLSDGSAGGIEADSITFELCRQYVDQCVAITEDEIASALCEFIDAHSMLIEGAAAAAIAGLVARRDMIRGQTVVVILCGANIGSEKLRQAMRRTGGSD